VDAHALKGLGEYHRLRRLGRLIRNTRRLVSLAYAVSSPAQDTLAEDIADSRYDRDRDRIPEQHEERAVVRAVGGVEGRGDAAGGKSGDGSGNTWPLRRSLAQGKQEAGKWADRQQRNKRQAKAGIVPDHARSPAISRHDDQFGGNGRKQEDRRRQKHPAPKAHGGAWPADAEDDGTGGHSERDRHDEFEQEADGRHRGVDVGAKADHGEEETAADQHARDDRQSQGLADPHADRRVLRQKID